MNSSSIIALLLFTTLAAASPTGFRGDYDLSELPSPHTLSILANLMIIINIVGLVCSCVTAIVGCCGLFIGSKK